MRLVSFRLPTGQNQVGRVEDQELWVLEAPDMISWLSGEGHGETGQRLAVADVELLAPVPRPPSVRDFFAFEGHVEAGWRRRGSEIPPAWYEAPAFYFSNPASIHGPGEVVARPPATQMLDFELEIAAVIGAGGEIAGFTLMNDWSARDVQANEMTVGLGPAKGKDFATSLGPWLVTPDELPTTAGRHDLEATVSVNGEELSRTSAAEQHWTWAELAGHAARDTALQPGDVLGSGTLNRGCLLELGPLEGERWLEPGDEVVIAADGLGELATRIV
ncbi:MAG: fumarylacetoacetate hydrolase family protein [Actinomycetota bacterium]|nr:fumarylacetoacetate hydrolase family protein [Actinomycetota bacterium]